MHPQCSVGCFHQIEILNLKLGLSQVTRCVWNLSQPSCIKPGDVSVIAIQLDPKSDVWKLYARLHQNSLVANSGIRMAMQVSPPGGSPPPPIQQLDLRGEAVEMGLPRAPGAWRKEKQLTLVKGAQGGLVGAVAGVKERKRNKVARGDSQQVTQATFSTLMCYELNTWPCPHAPPRRELADYPQLAHLSAEEAAKHRTRHRPGHNRQVVCHNQQHAVKVRSGTQNACEVWD